MSKNFIHWAQAKAKKEKRAKNESKHFMPRGIV